MLVLVTPWYIILYPFVLQKELIVFIVALIQGKIDIVQASILGSILSNILLVTALLDCAYHS